MGVITVRYCRKRQLLALRSRDDLAGNQGRYWVHDFRSKRTISLGVFPLRAVVSPDFSSVAYVDDLEDGWKVICIARPNSDRKLATSARMKAVARVTWRNDGDLIYLQDGCEVRALNITNETELVSRLLWRSECGDN